MSDFWEDYAAVLLPSDIPDGVVEKALAQIHSILDNTRPVNQSRAKHYARQLESIRKIIQNLRDGKSQ